MKAGQIAAPAISQGVGLTERFCGPPTSQGVVSSKRGLASGLRLSILRDGRLEPVNRPTVVRRAISKKATTADIRLTLFCRRLGFLLAPVRARPGISRFRI